MLSVDLYYRLLPDEAAEPVLKNNLIRDLSAIESEKSIQQAARSLGLSYRHLWGRIEAAETLIGQKLIVREQGRPARLTPLAMKLLWAERSVRARNAMELTRIRAELNHAYATACDPDATIIRIMGCYDSRLVCLQRHAQEQKILLDLRFNTSRQGLEALKAGDCDIAGFNFPSDGTPNGAAAKLYSQLIDPDGMEGCLFCVRRQGLALKPSLEGSITCLKDVVEKKIPWVGRAPGTGTSVLTQEYLHKEGLVLKDLNLSSIEPSHLAVATAIAAGNGEAGMCLETAAAASKLVFVPVASEDYWLIWRKETFAEPEDRRRLETLLAI
ncbi:substrate-binding domain-containing protein, partial [Sutterella sp.]|uniref:substrate-binding domain-containing protein n=1 Tax=Sutterella sp. TaxID=1981025 RepID=UPI0026E04D72